MYSIYNYPQQFRRVESGNYFVPIQKRPEGEEG